MHSAPCPACGTQVKFDFLPVAGLVWCPTCQKMFSPPVVSKPGQKETGQADLNDDSNGESRC